MVEPIIPVIDVSEILNDNGRDIANIASQIGDAYRGLGFFCITGHGVPSE